jgi:iron complex outermembrane recepter protein
VKDWWTVDVQANYEAPWQITLTVGCQNVADRNAPRSLGQNGEGYDAAVANNQGRFMYARVTKTF